MVLLSERSAETHVNEVEMVQATILVPRSFIFLFKNSFLKKQV